MARASLYLRDLLFPPLCSGCAERGVWVCERCLASVPPFASIVGCCARCGLPVASGRCGCVGLHPRVVRAVSAFPYTGWVAAAVRGAKYEGERDRARVLGAVLGASSAGDLIRRADVVVPVPMFRTRERERGYNQAMLIAESICTVVGAPPAKPVLVQSTERPSQVGLSAGARRSNVRGSFAIEAGVALRQGLHIVIVDDVRTTGATLTACVEALTPVRPRRIDVVTFAAEISDDSLERIGLRRENGGRR